MSRVSVTVVLRVSTSTSPDCSAVKRCCVFSGVNLTLVASPNIVEAMARHRSTSMPLYSPLLSAIEKPGMPVDTPHWTNPFFLTLSKVAPALAAADAANSAAPIAASFSTFIVISVWDKSSRTRAGLGRRMGRMVASAQQAAHPGIPLKYRDTGEIKTLFSYEKRGRVLARRICPKTHSFRSGENVSGRSHGYAFSQPAHQEA